MDINSSIISNFSFNGNYLVLAILGSLVILCLVIFAQKFKLNKKQKNQAKSVSNIKHRTIIYKPPIIETSTTKEDENLINTLSPLKPLNPNDEPIYNTIIKKMVNEINQVPTLCSNLSQSLEYIKKNARSETKSNTKDEAVIRESKEESLEENNNNQSKVKYIGYNPINIFAQTEPLNYPYVLMPPKAKNVIKFPRKGKTGRKGYKENDFLIHISDFFKDQLKINSDSFLFAKNNNRYEPDFTVIDETNGINIFIDIEIDEPYEGLNDIEKRKVTHYQYSDTNRNNEFRNRGWIVIRFAEIQVHQNPNGCCRFIADVIKSIHPTFKYPERLSNIARINPIKQWTKEIAQQWSIQKYREQYLEIPFFGHTQQEEGENICTPLIEEKEIEDNVIDDNPISIPKIVIPPTKYNIINSAIKNNKYLSFYYHGSKTIVKPLKIADLELLAFCYIKNAELKFSISDLTNIIEKDNYYTHKFISPNLGVQKVEEIMNIVIPNHIYVRMRYTRREWTNMLVNPDTGEFIIDKTESEESIRTVSNIQIDTNGWGNNYIRTYCHKREEERIFKFDRISEIELLDIK